MPLPPPLGALLPGVLLGEAAIALVQNVDYEMPYLRKQAAKHSQMIADAERRRGEYTRSAAAAASTFKQARAPGPGGRDIQGFGAGAGAGTNEPSAASCPCGPPAIRGCM